MIYNSCFPPNIEVVDWFSHHSSGHSVTMQLLSTNPNNGGGNWIGLALYAHFSDLRDVTNFGQQIPHNYLTCHMETERISLKPVHQYRIINDECKKTSSNSEFIWVSYIPRSWFGDQLSSCRYIEASFESGKQGIRVQKCGLCLLDGQGMKKFKLTINHCVTLRDRFLVSTPNDKGKNVMQ